MGDCKETNNNHLDNTVMEVFRLHRRIGFRNAKIEITHCLIDKDRGFDFTLYDEKYGNLIHLYSITQKDSQRIILYDIALRYANARN